MFLIYQKTSTILFEYQRKISDKQYLNMTNRICIQAMVLAKWNRVIKKRQFKLFVYPLKHCK